MNGEREGGDGEGRREGEREYRERKRGGREKAIACSEWKSKVRKAKS